MDSAAKPEDGPSNLTGPAAALSDTLVPPKAVDPSSGTDSGRATADSEESSEDNDEDGLADLAGDENDEPTELVPYDFNLGDVTEAAKLLDDAFRDRANDYESTQRVFDAARVMGRAPDDPLIRELASITSYQLRRLARGRAGCELGSTRGEPVPWPTPPREVPESVAQLWRSLAVAVTEPEATARLEDLLFVGRHGNGRTHAQAAANAYMAVAANPPVDLGVIDALTRAWTLARALKLNRIDAEARAKLAEIATALLDESPHERAGILMPALAILAEGQVDKTATDPIDADGILGRAATTLVNGDHCTRIAQHRRSRTSDPAQRATIDNDEIDGYFRDADKPQQAAVRMHFLEAASRRAKQLGLEARVREAAAAMQRIKPSELGMRRFTATSNIPRHVPESILSGFTESAEWQEGLWYFFSMAPPTGDIETINREAVRPQGLADLFQSVVVGNFGLPKATTSSDDDKVAHRKSQIARTRAQFYGRLMWIGLDRMSDRYGIPSEDDLVSAIVSRGGSDPQLARSLAKSLRHFWAGDYESCVHLAAPKFEAALRNLLRELDEGVYRVQVGNDPGGFPGFFVLLAELERIALDESWAFFFRWLFLGPYGANLRNEVAHGFVHDLSPTYAAMTLRALAVLVTVAGPPTYDNLGATEADPTPDEPTPRTTAEITAVLRSPLGPPTWLDKVASHVMSLLENLLWRIEAARIRARMKR